MFHKFIDKFVFFHQSVAAVAGRYFVVILHLVRLDARIPDEKRNRFVGVCSKFAGGGMVGKHGDGYGLIPIFHCFIDRADGTLVQILDGHYL